jgi:hypothetical protein
VGRSQAGASDFGEGPEYRGVSIQQQVKQKKDMYSCCLKYGVECSCELAKGELEVASVVTEVCTGQLLTRSRPSP